MCDAYCWASSTTHFGTEHPHTLDSPAPPPPQARSHSLTHSLNHLLTHSFTHSLTDNE
jgi:hypothetical protein